MRKLLAGLAVLVVLFGVTSVEGAVLTFEDMSVSGNEGALSAIVPDYGGFAWKNVQSGIISRASAHYRVSWQNRQTCAKRWDPLKHSLCGFVFSSTEDQRWRTLLESVYRM